MVSKASEDLPEPESPVNTTSLSRGIARSTFLRLCSRAPRMVIARPPNKTSAPSFAGDDKGLALAMRVLDGNFQLRGANRACARPAPMLEQTRNTGKAPLAPGSLQCRRDGAPSQAPGAPKCGQVRGNGDWAPRLSRFRLCM